LIPQAARHLKPGGLLVLELGYNSLPAVQPLLDPSHWTDVGVTNDLAGIPRVLAAERVRSSNWHLEALSVVAVSLKQKRRMFVDTAEKRRSKNLAAQGTSFSSNGESMPDLARFRAKHDPAEVRDTPLLSSILHVDMDAFFVSVELIE